MCEDININVYVFTAVSRVETCFVNIYLSHWKCVAFIIESYDLGRSYMTKIMIMRHHTDPTGTKT